MISMAAMLAAFITSAAVPDTPASAAPHPNLGAGCAPRSTPFAANTALTTMVDGVERSYRVHLPRGYTGRKAYPLILAFHGHAESSARMERYSGLSRLPAIVVYADGLTGTDGKSSWQGAPYSSPKSNDIAFTRNMLREMRRDACVDSGRIYAVGRSNGGGLVAMLSCRLPAQFAALAVVNGALYNQTWRGCEAAAPSAIIELHGTADKVMGYRGGTRHGERYTGVQTSLSRWAARDRCLPYPSISRISPTVTRYDWSLCAAPGAQVTHYQIAGGSHAWPGSPRERGSTSADATTSAAPLIWQFFNHHNKAARGGMQ